MKNPFDELAVLVGRVLANRWLREQPSARHDATGTQADDDSQPAVIRDEEQLDAVPHSGSGVRRGETPFVAKYR